MVISDPFGVRGQFKLDSSASESDERNSGGYQGLLFHQTPHVEHDSLGAAGVALELIRDGSAGIAFQYLLSQFLRFQFRLRRVLLQCDFKTDAGAQILRQQMDRFIFRLRPDAPFWRLDKYETPLFDDQNVIGHHDLFRSSHRLREKTEVVCDRQSRRHEKCKGSQAHQRSCAEIKPFHWVELGCAIFQVERMTVQTMGVPGGSLLLFLKFGSNKNSRWGAA